MKITYTQVGDYLIPNIILTPIPEQDKKLQLDRYVRIHRSFLHEHYSILYNQLVLSEKLFATLYEIDETVNARFSSSNNTDKHLIESAILTDLVYSKY